MVKTNARSVNEDETIEKCNKKEKIGLNKVTTALKQRQNDVTRCLIRPHQKYC